MNRVQQKAIHHLLNTESLYLRKQAGIADVGRRFMSAISTGSQAAAHAARAGASAVTRGVASAGKAVGGAVSKGVSAVGNAAANTAGKFVGKVMQSPSVAEATTRLGQNAGKAAAAGAQQAAGDLIQKGVTAVSDKFKNAGRLAGYAAAGAGAVGLGAYAARSNRGATSQQQPQAGAVQSSS